MQVIETKNLEVLGLPLYEMQQLFKAEGSFKDVKISMITLLPGVRVPAEGTGFHEEDEYSFFTEGEVYTCSGDQQCLVKAGQATLIPRGEKHWCRNEADKPCKLVCIMIK